jgi:hypothetical protein
MKLSDFKQIIKEAIEEEAKQITEVESIAIDEVGKFFIVEKPSQDSSMEDVVYELTLPEFALQIKGGLKVKNIDKLRCILHVLQVYHFHFYHFI